jgi:hypothetical protein
MNKFTNLDQLKQAGNVFTMSWVYSGIAAYFSQQNKFKDLAFTSSANTIFCKDWNTNFVDSNPDEQKYFGLVNEGHIDYWFPSENWKNVTLITGHDHVLHHPNNIKSIGFNRWDILIQQNFSNPVVHNEVNRQELSIAEYDVLCLIGQPRDHRLEFLSNLQCNEIGLKIVTDSNQRILDTEYRTTALGFESFFNKCDIDKFNSYQGFSSNWSAGDKIYLDHQPHKIMHGSCRVNVVLETTMYDVKKPLLSEKTWKALAHRRPFVILGDTNSISTLKEKGFKTFANFCDESYDSETDSSKRIKMVAVAMHQLVAACKTHATEIDKICKHNQELFFDTNRTFSDLAAFGKLCLKELYNI